MERRLLLDVVVAERAAVLELLALEDDPLLFGRNALVVLNFALDHVGVVHGVHLKGDFLAREGKFYKDLHDAMWFSFCVGSFGLA